VEGGFPVWRKTTGAGLLLCTCGQTTEGLMEAHGRTTARGCWRRTGGRTALGLTGKDVARVDATGADVAGADAAEADAARGGAVRERQTCMGKRLGMARSCRCHLRLQRRRS
jgi:hypothetical protein